MVKSNAQKERELLKNLTNDLTKGTFITLLLVSNRAVAGIVSKVDEKYIYFSKMTIITSDYRTEEVLTSQLFKSQKIRRIEVIKISK